MTTKNENRDNRNIKVAITATVAVAVIILLMLLLRSCGSNNNGTYTMQLNGDNPFEIALNDVFVDPGVTFFDEDGNQVSDDKQAELEKDLTTTGEVNTAKAGEYPVTYEYEEQTLERTVKVLAGSADNKPNGEEPSNTHKPDEDDKSSDGETDASGSESSESTPAPSTNPNKGNTGNNSNNQTNPSNGDNNGNNGNNDNNGNDGNTTPTPGPSDGGDKPSQKEVYHLPTNVTFASRTVTYNGEEYEIVANNVPYGIIPIYTSNSGTNAGRYDAEVVFVLSDSLKSKYSSIEPASMNATLTIRQATPSYTVPTGLTAEVGDTLADVKLPKGFSFEKSLNTSVGSAGYNPFLVTFTPDDTINFKTVKHIEVLIKVTQPGGGGDDDVKVVYNLPSNTVFNSRTVTYNGSSYTLLAENVPEDIVTRYVNNSGINAGTYNATVYFSLGDALIGKCSRVEPSSMTATLTILKAVPRYTVPTGLTAKTGQTLRDVTLPKGFTFEDPLTTSVGNAGAHTFKVTYTPDDTKNYEIVKGIDVIITVTNGSDPGPGPDPVKPVYKLPANVTFPAVNETYTGQTYTAEAVNVPEGIIATYSNASRSEAGTQQATVAFALNDSMAKIYSGVEPTTMTTTITIAKATPSYTVPTNLTATEGQTLADVRNQLGKGFAFESPLSTSVGSAGDNEFYVSYTPDDTTNYKVVTNIKVIIHVSKAPDPEKPKYTIPANVAFNDLTRTYTGNAIVLEAQNVPDVLTAVYSNNSRTIVGSQTATVTFSLSSKGLETYSGIEGSNTMTAVLTIEKAIPSYKVPTNLVAQEGQTLADVVSQLSGTGFTFEALLSTSVGNAGDNTFKVTYTPSDTGNYEIVTGIDVTIHVTKAPDPTLPKFTIPADVAFNNLTETYTGSEYVITAENVPDELTPIYSNNRRTIAGFQTATVTFVLSDKGLESYSGIEGSNTMTAVLTINKATPNYTVPTNLTAEEGQTLADVASQLNGTGFAFQDSLSTPVGSAGDNEFKVSYTPADNDNYEIVKDIMVTIHVSKAKPVLTLTQTGTFDDVQLPYNGSEQFITAKNLPEGVTPSYSNNGRTDLGSQTATVTFTLSAELQEQYSGVSPSSMTATLEIIKGTPSYTAPGTLTAEEGQTLGDIAGQLGKGFSFEDNANTPVGSVGNHTFKVTYTPDDTTHYNVVTGIDVTVNVTAKTKPVLTLTQTGTFDDVQLPYNGSEQFITAKNLPEGVTPSYSNNGRTDLGSQTATVTFTLSAELQEQYSGVSPSSMTATLEIIKGTPSYTAPGTLTAEEGQTLGDIAGQLGKGFSFEDGADTPVGSVGNHTFKVTYTPDDTTHYNVVTGIDVTVNVTAKTKPVLNLTQAGTFDDVQLPYNGSEQFITAKNLPVGVIPSYSNNGRTDLGSQTATVTFELSAELQAQYSGVSPSSMTATLEIIKGTPSYTAPGTLTAEEGQTLGDIVGQLGKGFSFEDGADTPVGSVGNHTFKVTYTPDDTTHYNVVTGIDVTVNVTAKQPTEVDKTALEAAKKEAATAVTEMSKYTADSYLAFETAYDDAMDMLEETQDQVDAKTAKIREALNLLKLNSTGGDFTDNLNTQQLEQAKNEANTAIAEMSKYTIPSYLAFKSAYDATKDMSENSQEQIDAKTAKIREALALLQLNNSGGDFTDNLNTEALKAAQAEAKGAIAEMSKYTAESYLAFKTAYDDADAMPEQTQAEVDAKAAKIQEALQLLKLITDDGDFSDSLNKEALKSAQEAADTAIAELSKYTVTSYLAFKSAYDATKSMPEDTQEEVDAKTAKIQAALALLEENTVSVNSDFSDEEMTILSDELSTTPVEASTTVEETITDEDVADVVDEEESGNKDATQSSTSQDSTATDEVAIPVVIENPPADDYKQEETIYSEENDSDDEDSDEDASDDDGQSPDADTSEEEDSSDAE